MASNAPPSREERGGLSVGTLMIASVASLTAAVVTSYFWARGTPIAAAVTPVIVALVSEMLNRPATVISRRFTTETDALPEAAGAGPPPPRRETRGEAARDDEATKPLDATRPTEARDGHGAGGGPGGGVRVYGGEPGRSRAWKAIAATAALAFVIAASVLTLPELVTGQSVGGGDRGTTFFGGSSRGGGADDRSSESRERDRTAGEPVPEQEEEPAPEEEPAAPEGRPEPQPRAVPQGQTPSEEPTQTAPEETVPETTPTQPPPAP